MRRLGAGAAIAAMHVPPMTLLFLGWRRSYWAIFAAFYLLACFALGGALHRYFSHKPFRTTRWFQFVLALAASAFFGDPIGFAGRHRLHHRYSDTESDFHGPHRGFWFSWIGHLLEDGYPEEQLLGVTRDLAAYPELLWLHRWYFVPGLAAMVLTYLAGGYGALAAGYCLSWCLIAIHGASAVNYFCHNGALRPYATGDHSSNRPVLGVMLLGEGWHNNHHRCPGVVRSGFEWHEPDLLYWMFRALGVTGVIWGLREPTENVRRERLAAITGAAR
jgi:stearoyl-CoA desaturase (delta-9 desaturase)